MVRQREKIQLKWMRNIEEHCSAGGRRSPFGNWDREVGVSRLVMMMMDGVVHDVGPPPARVKAPGPHDARCRLRSRRYSTTTQRHLTPAAAILISIAFVQISAHFEKRIEPIARSCVDTPSREFGREAPNNHSRLGTAHNLINFSSITSGLLTLVGAAGSFCVARPSSAAARPCATDGNIMVARSAPPDVAGPDPLQLCAPCRHIPRRLPAGARQPPWERSSGSGAREATTTVLSRRRRAAWDVPNILFRMRPYDDAFRYAWR